MSLPEKMNICIVAAKLPIVGRAAQHSFLWPIAKGLTAKGHHVTVISSKSPLSRYEFERFGVQVYFIKEKDSPYKHLNFAKGAKRAFEDFHSQNSFHLVHSIDANGYKIAKHKKSYNVATAFDVGATQMSQLFSILAMAQETLGSQLSTSLAMAYKFLTTYYGGDRNLLKKADGVFVSSPQQRIVLERYYLYPDARTYTIPYGIELGDLSAEHDNDTLKESLGIPKESPTVVTISDMSEFGEVRNLLHSFQKVATKKPSARLIIVGNGPLFKEIEYETLTLALGSKVILTGAVSHADLPSYISLADVFVNLSSRTSGFEPSIIEAMAQKKVVIGSEVSPISNIVEDGVDGFLIRPADTPFLSSLLMEIFTHQLPTPKIGKNAREKVLKLFDATRMIDQLIEAYQKIMENHK